MNQHTKSERKVLDRMANSPLGWIEIHNEPGERRLYLATLGLAHRGEIVAEVSRPGVLHVTKIGGAS